MGLDDDKLRTRFDEGYRHAAIYESVLPPHFYCGLEDTEIVGALLRRLLGPPRGDLGPGLEVGCGPGRMTATIFPYVSSLVGADKSAGMAETFGRRFPEARTMNLDTESSVRKLLSEGLARSFAVIGSFWSLNYPLLDCFEELNDSGIVTGDELQGRIRAAAIVDGLVELLATEGVLLGLFFDADTVEQRFVTELWERIQPFPGTGRRFTWELLHERLLDHERTGVGRLLTMRLPGSARFEDAARARDWFEVVHLNRFPELMRDKQVGERIEGFLRRFVADTGVVILPSGVNVFVFQRTGSTDAPAMSGVFGAD